MVPMVTERMLSRVVSDFIWSDPIETAKVLVAELRSQCDLLIALTHIGFKQDQILAETCPVIDVILGGHSHTVLETPVQVGSTFVCQGGSHGKWLGVYQWDSELRRLSGGLTPL